jgi:hypothetical protein
MNAKLLEERTVFHIGTPARVERVRFAPDFHMTPDADFRWVHQLQPERFPAGRPCSGVENEMTFLTLPQIPRTIAILGSGDAVSHLRLISWLKQMRLLYWGDMDTHGFEALSFLRSHHQHAESIMMDVEAYTQFRQFAVQASAYASRAELHLSEVERALFNTLGDEGRLLEQERITLTYAKARLETVLGSIG